MSDNTALTHSLAYIEQRVRWRILKDTLTVIDEKNALWVARVSTTHRHKNGEPDYAFTVLVKGTCYFDIDDAELDGVVKALTVSPQYGAA